MTRYVLQSTRDCFAAKPAQDEAVKKSRWSPSTNFFSAGVNLCLPKPSLVAVSRALEDALEASVTAVPANWSAEITAEGFEELVRQHQRRIFRVLLLMVRDADLADSLTQECFLRVYERRKQFRGDCPVEAWVLRIAINLARDHGRNRRTNFWRRLVGLDEKQAAIAWTVPDRQPSPEQSLLLREELAAVWSAMAELSARQRAIFVLYFVEEMRLREIGQALKIENGTVKAHLFRAVSAVRKAMEAQGWK